MKLKTQHIRVAAGHDVYQLHRDGKTTWKTTGDGKDQTAHDVTKHESVAAAKALFGDITSVGK